MDCSSASAAVRVCECGDGVQWPKDRNPMFFTPGATTRGCRSSRQTAHRCEDSGMHAGDLEQERAHLAEARRALAAMRDRTRSLDSSAAGDSVSQIALESAMYRRMRALEDDPTVPLFFGRLVYDEAHAEQGATFYI